MKSHDCHVLLKQILPVAIRGIMGAHVREKLFGLCNLFDVISQKSIGVRQLRRLQEEIVVIVGGQAVLGRQQWAPTPWLTERHGYDPTSHATVRAVVIAREIDDKK